MLSFSYYMEHISKNIDSLKHVKCILLDTVIHKLHQSIRSLFHVLNLTSFNKSCTYQTVNNISQPRASLPNLVFKTMNVKSKTINSNHAHIPPLVFGGSREETDDLAKQPVVDARIHVNDPFHIQEVAVVLRIVTGVYPASLRPIFIPRRRSYRPLRAPK